MRDIEKDKVDKIVEQGVAVTSPSTDWAALVVFAPKKDGTLQFCVDYRRLNALTVRDTYPIPRMDECIDSLETRRSSVPCTQTPGTADRDRTEEP